MGGSDLTISLYGIKFNITYRRMNYTKVNNMKWKDMNIELRALWIIVGITVTLDVGIVIYSIIQISQMP